MSAIGLYQVCPGCGEGEYSLLPPAFAFVEITLSDNVLIMIAHRESEADVYVEGVTWNGEEYDCAFVKHQMIVKGGVFEFTLSSTPNKEWGKRGRECLSDY